MKTINQKVQLATKIAFLRSKQEKDFLHLKDQYHVTIDSFKPINLIKNSIEDAITSTSIKSSLIKGTVGFGVNYLTNNFLNHNSGSNKKSILNTVLKFVVKSFIGNKKNI
jgi:hypothetical protein